MNSVLDPYELQRRVHELEAENMFLKQWVSTLQETVNKLAKLQPPPAIILKCTPEQLERAKAIIKLAEEQRGTDTDTD